MTDMTKPVVVRPGSPLSGDLIQLLYRLSAALLICIVLALLNDSFLSLGNILNVLRQASLLFFIASGLTLVVLTGGLDLSVGANVALSAAPSPMPSQTTRGMPPSGKRPARSRVTPKGCCAEAASAQAARTSPSRSSGTRPRNASVT